MLAAICNIKCRSMRGSNMHVWLQRECVEGACLRCSSVCGSSVYCVRLECGATPGRSEMTTAIFNVELLSLAVMHNITLNHKTLTTRKCMAYAWPRSGGGVFVGAEGGEGPERQLAWAEHGEGCVWGGGFEGPCPTCVLSGCQGLGFEAVIHECEAVVHECEAVVQECEGPLPYLTLPLPLPPQGFVDPRPWCPLA